ncbi:MULTISPECIES: alpha/beta hydrolase [unclassified Arthrobacter]|uniref:alpha/beta hydrolase n=2 Tax=Arthrobacter TaxID=1663 RepID=UPI001D145527|nr:alpha/beta hydrolase [Arthrobacter sp. zg.Y20]
MDLSGTEGLPDPEAVMAAASGLAGAGDTFATGVEDLHGGWSGGMAQYYKAPEQEQVCTLLGHPKDTAKALRDSTASAAQALKSFAEGALDIVARRAALVAELESYGQTGGPAFDPTTDRPVFQHRANVLADDYRALDDRCVNALNALHRNTTSTFASYGPPDPAAAVNAATAVYNTLTQGRSTDPQRDLTRLLRSMDLMTPEEIAAFKADNPGWALVAAPVGLDPSANKDLWASLRHPEIVIAALPLLAGNLEGVPYSDRAKGNQLALQAAAAQDGLTQEQETAFKNLAESLESPSPETNGQRHLLAFDPSVIPPLAMVSIGNVDEADYVTVNVPGMDATTERMTDWTDAAQSLYDAQEKIDGNSSHAVIAWMNYTTPDLFPSSADVLQSDLARAGGDRLAANLTGIHTVLGDNAFLTVTAHSYGTPTTGDGLEKIDFQVDAVVLYGSAGMDTDVTRDATSMQVAQDQNGNPQVFATQARADNVAGRGILGSQLVGDGRLGATNPLFGAKVFSSDGNELLAPTDEHSAYTGRENRQDSQGYLDPGTQSLRSIARITMDLGEQVDVRDPMPLDYREHHKVTHPQLYGPRF